jgi:hypothetical protein
MASRSPAQDEASPFTPPIAPNRRRRSDTNSSPNWLEEQAMRAHRWLMSVDPKVEAIAVLRTSVLDAPGVLDRPVREAVFGGQVTDEPYAGYVAKIRDSSYRVTTSDFTAMADAGLTEDAIFEVTLAAALGAAHRRLTAGLAAMRDEV